ncbi:hypothetical protein B9Z55_009095 [Caenorhabditis nigoni]|uniref:BTB domain-containing protein n=1 Tax=Caenorhabditis nigoni TaxID=1611254 RepID=A0A2G5UQJ1_9PELO|nr:hypothetical protein B9Z55_009095 [Caenorhabditis nigoni]
MSAVRAENTDKTFVIKHVFENVSSYEEDWKKLKFHDGPKENHFGATWIITMMEQESGSLPVIRLSCYKEDRGHWRIYSEVTLKIMKTDGTWETCITDDSSVSDMLSRCIMDMPDGELSDYLVDGRLSMEIEVKIKKEEISGAPWLRKFNDAEAREFSDIVLVAGTDEFHINKMYLSLHSTYFKSLFSSQKPTESLEKPIIKLDDVHPLDFQRFLEVLYGEPTMWDYSVDETLELAFKYNAKTVIRRCEDFLLSKSEISRKRKFATAVKYDMSTLKRKCIDEAKTTAEIRELAPDNADDFEPKVWEELFREACRSR